LYFVPVSFDIYISIYNKLALPYIPSTVEVVRNEGNDITLIQAISWEEYAEWAKAVYEGTGTPKTGFPMAVSGSQLLYPMGGMALAFGSESFPKINDSGALSAWNVIAGMAADGSLVDESILSTVNQPDSLLSSGTLWLSFGHMGPIGSAYHDHPENYVLGPAPHGESTQTAGSTAGAWGYGIVRDAPHAAAGEAWIEFMTDPEINYLYCSGLGGVISPIEEVQGELGASSTDQIMSVGLASYQNGVRIAILDVSRYSSWTAVKAVYTDLMNRLLTGSPLTQEEADAFQSQIDDLFLD
jgi:multiple sugar transport system substrate-binding protein